MLFSNPVIKRARGLMQVTVSKAILKVEKHKPYSARVYSGFDL